jgi:hypothetical protein
MIESGSTTVGVAAISDRGFRSYVDWAAIFAGSVVAAAIFFVFNAFGTALGLSLSVPRLAEGNSAKGYAIAVGIWVLWVTISSFIAGGYLTGRLRRGLSEASAHETHVRDGVHGLVVWGLGIILGAYLATVSIAGAAKTGAEAATGAASAITSVAGNSDKLGYLTDDLLRSDAQPTGNVDATRSEVTRVLTRSAANGTLSQEDRDYLARLTAARAGVPQAEAEKRADALSARIREMDADAKKAALAARRIGILIAFLTAASLAAGAAGAWWGASLGGRHRDENTDYAHLVRW